MQQSCEAIISSLGFCVVGVALWAFWALAGSNGRFSILLHFLEFPSHPLFSSTLPVLPSGPLSYPPLSLLFYNLPFDPSQTSEVQICRAIFRSGRRKTVKQFQFTITLCIIQYPNLSSLGPFALLCSLSHAFRPFRSVRPHRPFQRSLALLSLGWSSSGPYRHRNSRPREVPLRIAPRLFRRGTANGSSALRTVLYS